jgi:exopolysaccharide production protein ExoQ
MCACALAVFWLLLESWEPHARARDKSAPYRYLILLLMNAWLVVKSNSSTGLACSVMGCGLMAAMKFAPFRRGIKHLELITAAAVLLVILMHLTGLWSWLTSSFAAAVGRDPSFHGRSEIWAALLKQDINPVLGVGYYSFWTDARMEKLSKGYHYLLNEAHNGYLETYLNSGLLGLLLLFVLMVSTARKLKRDMVHGISYASLRFAFLLSAAFYAVSEAIFNRLLMTWFVLLLALMVPPRMRGRKRLQQNAAYEKPAYEPAVDLGNATAHRSGHLYK